MAQDADEAGPIAVEEQFFEQDIEKKSPTGFLPRLPRGIKIFNLIGMGKTHGEIYLYMDNLY
jgi:hypothetical protein